MPFKSKQQWKWMFANHPEMARRWAHHTKDIKALPQRAKKKKKVNKKKAILMTEMFYRGAS